MVHFGNQIFGLIVGKMGINIKRDFGMFVARQHLYGLDVNTGQKQASDVGMSELVGRHLKVNAVYYIVVMGRPLSQDRGHSVQNLLTVDVAIISPLPNGAGTHIPPYPAPLCLREGTSVPVGNHKVRGGFLFDKLQAFHQLWRDRSR